MVNEGRWPSDNQAILPAKIGECVWWLAVLSERNGIDFSEAVEGFLKTRLEEIVERLKMRLYEKNLYETSELIYLLDFYEPVISRKSKI